MAKSAKTDSRDRPPEKAPEYEVGYGKPPMHTRVKPGQVLNPKGRPKGQRNVATVLKQALNERTNIREGGCVRSVTKLDAVILKIIHDSGMGNTKTQSSLITLMRLGRFFEADDNSPASQAPVTLDDDALIEDYIERNRERLGLIESSDSEGTPTEIAKPKKGED